MDALQPPVSAFATAAAAMPAALRSILVDGVDPTAVDAAALRLALQQAQCYDAPAGHIVQLPAVLPAAACAALRAAVDAQHETASGPKSSAKGTPSSGPPPAPPAASP